ncbi:M16 family metallopeptidase [Polyangium jinanense]|uniref:Insulinase family protein n=1 Tax=Polyangium jinanense TaxID=2829994 RepID=A0A9X4AXA4_9BACT|nr:pitrilysin family protein [Polyangium jinanense]MDC3961604.1 insulinase family protein [Polyangium jinanense]MDC3988174.1 insulinase family protein [Polyangium jinanense]
MRKRASVLGLLALLVAGCPGQTVAPPPLHTPPAKTAEAKPSVPQAAPEPKEPPPESAPPRPFSTPKTTWIELKNGLRVVSLLDRAVPVAHLRLVVLAGTAVDGEKTGLSAVCARAVASSGAGSLDAIELRKRLEGLGASLSVDLNADRVVYGISVPAPRLAEAAEVLASIVGRPRLDPKEIERVQGALAERAAEKARSDGTWGALMMLHRDLFALPSEHHPYASFDATAEEIGQIKPADCKEYHRRYFVPKNMIAAITGDVPADEVRKVAEKHLGGLAGKAAPAPSFTDPMPPESTKITLVDRPGSTQSEIVVGSLGPKESEPTFAGFVAAAEVLGGAITGRLAVDLRNQRGLVSRAFAETVPFANGPSAFYVYTKTNNESTGDALTAVLDHLRALTQEVPSPREMETAARFLGGSRAVITSRPGGRADELCDLGSRGLPDEALDERISTLRAMAPEAAAKAFFEHVRPGHAVLVVSGDATRVGPLLQRFGEVKVVDPTRNFARTRTLPAAAAPSRP